VVEVPEDHIIEDPNEEPEEPEPEPVPAIPPTTEEVVTVEATPVGG